MKRYSCISDEGGQPMMFESDTGDWYHRDDLIAAGVLCVAIETLLARQEEVETMLASEVADNVRLRSRYTGDVEANLEQEICDLNDRIAGSIRIVPEGAPVKMADIWNWRCIDDVLGLYLWEGTLLQYTCTINSDTNTAQPVRLIAAATNTETSHNA